MRKGVEQVYSAWLAHRPCTSSSIRTDGTTIYSYSTALVTRLSDGAVIFNETKYSNTTSQQQGSLRAAIHPAHTVDNVPRGANGETLRMALDDAILRGGRDF